MHYAWLHNDALWVFDETQLMGVAVETSAQLDAFRRLLGTAKPSRSIWMSATLGQQQLDTVDHPRPEAGWSVVTLDDEDLERDAVRQRTDAQKELVRSAVALDKGGAKDVEKGGAKSAYAQEVAARAVDLHRDGSLTLVI